MKKKSLILLIISIVLIVFILFTNGRFITKEVPSSEQLNTTTQTINAKIVSIEELGKHNSKESCWVSFQEEVYDITNYISNHPGGISVIIPLCGTSKEFENAFIQKHGSSKISYLKSKSQLIGDLDDTSA